MTLTDADACPVVRFVIAMKRGDLRDLLIAAGVGVIGIAVVAPIVGRHSSTIYLRIVYYSGTTGSTSGKYTLSLSQ